MSNPAFPKHMGPNSGACERHRADAVLVHLCVLHGKCTDSSLDEIGSWPPPHSPYHHPLLSLLCLPLCRMVKIAWILPNPILSSHGDPPHLIQMSFLTCHKAVSSATPQCLSPHPSHCHPIALSLSPSGTQCSNSPPHTKGEPQ